jgi:hypothetical protein
MRAYIDQRREKGAPAKPAADRILRAVREGGLKAGGDGLVSQASLRAVLSGKISDEEFEAVVTHADDGFINLAELSRELPARDWIFAQDAAPAPGSLKPSRDKSGAASWQSSAPSRGSSVPGGMKPSTYQLSRWESKAKTAKIGGFEAALKGGTNAPVRLLDAHWLLQLHSAGGTLGRRQTLPAEAFIGLTALKVCGCPQHHLPVVAVSYPWLSPAHPDPRGHHLRVLCAALRLLCAEPAEASATSKGPGGTQRYGVFIDFASLPQHPDAAHGVLRTESEDALFKEGLGSLASFYSDPATLVLRQTTLPEAYPEGYELPAGANVAAYAERGWCYTESKWASLTKGAKNALDLGYMRGDELSREALVAACTQGARPAPMLPAEFAASLEAKTFTNGKDDRPLVGALCAARPNLHCVVASGHRDAMSLQVRGRVPPHVPHARESRTRNLLIPRMLPADQEMMSSHLAAGNVHVLYYDGLGWGDVEVAHSIA